MNIDQFEQNETDNGPEAQDIEREAYETRQPAEAGFSCNFQIQHEKCGNMQVTFRGATAHQWAHVMADAEAFVRHMSGKGWHFPAQPTIAPPPTASKAETIVSAEQGATPEAKQAVKAIAASDAAIPPAPEGKEYKTVEIETVVIAPQPDDKTTIEFYGKGHKFPDLKASKWSIDRAAALLRHVTSAEVGKPAKLALACRAYYTDGRPNQNGQPFKDIQHVRPL